MAKIKEKINYVKVAIVGAVAYLGYKLYRTANTASKLSFKFNGFGGFKFGFPKSKISVYVSILNPTSSSLAINTMDLTLKSGNIYLGNITGVNLQSKYTIPGNSYNEYDFPVEINASGLLLSSLSNILKTLFSSEEEKFKTFLSSLTNVTVSGFIEANGIRTNIKETVARR